mmetsp:Transcript_15249/g.17688  ORF Transcript_15249/g.17688 Transcript_15249/m.17688 type:complete len:145 (-) Transcript_15249:68-502(-)
MQASQFLCVMSLSDLYEFEISTTAHSVSRAISIVSVLVLSGLLLTAVFAWRKYKNEFDPSRHTRLKELFMNTRNAHRARAYSVLLLSRRLFITSVLVLGQSLDKTVLVGILATAQLVYVPMVIFMKSQALVKNNVVEVTNEVFF